jgi:Bifunctional DNA primase/polymerase, N-terminal
MRALPLFSFWGSPELKKGVTRPADELEGGPKNLGPFASAAEALRRAGLTPIPVGGEDGKRPLLTGFTKWKRRLGVNTVRKWVDKHPDANVGVVTGPLSGISVIDIDSVDPMLQQQMVERFGDTPLKTRTPSGGCHLWYQYNGEASADFTQYVPVQLKAAGGFVVVPPSVRPTGPHAGRLYEFVEGTLADLVRLPLLKPEGIDRVALMATSPTRLRAVKEGRRNSSLFRHLLDHAPYCDDMEALLDVGMTFGLHDCDPSLPIAEIVKTVCSVWRMCEEGRLWAKGSEPRVIVLGTVIDALSGDALKFYLKLQLSHFDRSQFALAPKAMAEAQVIPGWSHHKYRAVRDELLDERCLRMVHKGGSRPGDPSLFAFYSPPTVMGTKSVRNITKHPPLSSLGWATHDSSTFSNISANCLRGALLMRKNSALWSEKDG